MLKLGRVTNVKVFFLVLVYTFNIDLFEILAAILEKGLVCVKFTEADISLDINLKSWALHKLFSFRKTEFCISKLSHFLIHCVPMCNGTHAPFGQEG